jgi:hypothetical protein
MSEAMAQGWRRLRSVGRVLRGHQEGQSLVIVTFAFIGILAFVGLAIDLGWVYVARVRVAQAADAAALAGASELPLEGPAQTRALVYLQENGYDYTADNVAVFLNGPTDPPGLEVPTTTVTIWVDTAYSREGGERGPINTSDRIQVRVQQQIFMTFMQFIGFRHVPVEATAEAENISSIDTVIVYDKSSSMEYDTVCYGCWEPSDAQYPSGTIYPLYWADHIEKPADHCLTDNTYYNIGDEIYIVIEAEEYSWLNHADFASYTEAITTPYHTYWAVQRNDYNEWAGEPVGALGRDAYDMVTFSGAYLAHHPFPNFMDTTGLGVTCRRADVERGNCRTGLPGDVGPFQAPRADYDFDVPRTDTYYVHIRAQGGREDRDRHIFWGLDGDGPRQENGFPQGPSYDGAVESAWEWRRLGRLSLLGGTTHRLHLWAGGAGFSVDRIIISTDALLNTEEKEYPPNNGRTGWACEPCDPRFAGRPGGHAWTAEEPYYRPDCGEDQRLHPIYDDEQPIRGALEAAKYFVSRLNPRLDQVGYVPYSYNAEIESELECLRRRGVPNLGSPDCDPDLCTPGVEPPCDPDCGCFSGVITNTVLYQLDRTFALGTTNIAEGIQLGIDVLSIEEGHYRRPGAAHVMVLLTDGQANRYPNDTCWEGRDEWPDTGTEHLDRAAECVIYYAEQARNDSIMVFTISLGQSADQELMAHVAQMTGGWHRYAPNTDALNEIFDELYERIFLRLIY